MTYETISTIKESWVKGFYENPTRLQEMEQEIHNMLLSDYYDDIGEYDKVTQLTSKIVDLAKIHYKENDWSKN